MNFRTAVLEKEKPASLSSSSRDAINSRQRLLVYVIVALARVVTIIIITQVHLVVALAPSFAGAVATWGAIVPRRGLRLLRRLGMALAVLCLRAAAAGGRAALASGLSGFGIAGLESSVWVPAHIGFLVTKRDCWHGRRW